MPDNKSKDNVGEMRQRQVEIVDVALDALCQLGAVDPTIRLCIAEDLGMLSEHAGDLADDLLDAMRDERKAKK